MAAQAFNQQHAQMTQMGMRPGQPGAPQHSPLAGEAGAGQHAPQGPDYPQPQQPGFPQGQQHAYPQPQQAVYPQQPSYQQGYGQPGYPQQPAYPQQGYPQQAWPQQGGYPGWPQQPYPRQPYAPYGMPYPQQPAYQTAPGYPQPMAGAPAGMPLPAESPQTGGAGQPWSPEVSLTERGREAVTYLLSHESVGSPSSTAARCPPGPASSSVSRTRASSVATARSASSPRLAGKWASRCNAVSGRSSPAAARRMTTHGYRQRRRATTPKSRLFG